jgi:hypothetical protein
MTRVVVVGRLLVMVGHRCTPLRRLRIVRHTPKVNGVCVECVGWHPL